SWACFSPSKIILKSRILLKADQGEAREWWSDDEICRARDTNRGMVTRVREELVRTEGLDAVFARKKRETPPIEPIFVGSSRRARNQCLRRYTTTYFKWCRPLVPGITSR